MSTNLRIMILAFSLLVSSCYINVEKDKCRKIRDMTSELTKKLSSKEAKYYKSFRANITCENISYIEAKYYSKYSERDYYGIAISSNNNVPFAKTALDDSVYCDVVVRRIVEQGFDVNKFHVNYGDIRAFRCWKVDSICVIQGVLTKEDKEYYFMLSAK